MAEAYKCDICQNFYSINKSLGVRTFDKSVIRLGTTSTFIDVCPDCTKAIQQVIDNRQR